ncbi:dihydrofolate reductase [Parvularcula sp. IMCC14364]|uniref:dihydrofolate reductase n=1 Tax=Parvularcula sp. IMCC14364 TaxID=3067902 RepID=UPI002741BB2E|nr:dihydrofolate reductase [Parvularcula sp. IMCC14364]
MIERQTNIPIALVVAAARNNTIGKDGGMPWRLSDDLKWFKKVTTGKPVIMGRKTFESIGAPLPNRDNIVITRNSAFAHDNVTVAASLEDAIAIAEAFALAREVEEICVIGGGTIYADTLHLAAKIYLTRIEADIAGDTFFPVLARDEWAEEEIQRIARDARNDHDARILTLTRDRD